MSIPKIIHYCWFGGNPIPQELQQYIQGWKTMMSDYTFIEWNEDNFDIHINSFVEDAYNNHKYAFVSDYARLYALCKYGGFYLDTDMELRKRLDDFLDYDFVTGFESEHVVSAGVIGACIQNPIVLEFMHHYDDLAFDIDHLVPNTYYLTDLLESKGIIINGQKQIYGSIFVGSNDYFLGFDYNDYGYCITDHTYTIHHSFGSWTSKKQKLIHKTKRFLRELLGKKGYLLLKKIIKR